MTRKMITVLVAGLLALLIVGIGSFWLGHVKTEQAAGIARVSVTTLGNAMQQDHFYSDYGGTAVIFTGIVTSSELEKGLTIVTFESHSAYGVACRFSSPPKIKIGDQIQVVAPGGQAVRHPFGVLLLGCEKV